MITSSTDRKSARQVRRTRARDRRQPRAHAVWRYVRVARKARSRTRTSVIAASATSASGTCTTKIARQSKSCVSTPPRGGPAAAPIVPARVQTTAPRTREPLRAARPRSEAASSSVPPSACRQRKPMRTSSVQAAAHRRSLQRRARRRRYPWGGTQPAGEGHEEERRDRDDEVVRADHPRDADERRVELAVEVGQREHDDRRVRESDGHACGQRDREDPRVRPGSATVLRLPSVARRVAPEAEALVQPLLVLRVEQPARVLQSRAALHRFAGELHSPSPWPAVFLEDVDVSEIRKRVPVRERPGETDLLVAVVEAPTTRVAPRMSSSTTRVGRPSAQ